MTPLEDSLSARRPRRVPAEWRGPILAAAVTDLPSPVRSAAPQKKTHGFWLAVAAVWILLAAAQLNGWRQDAAVAARLGPGPVRSIAEQQRRNRELERLIAELIAHEPPAAAVAWGPVFAPVSPKSPLP